MKSKKYLQRGNVMIIILVAIALFAALAYAFTQGSRGNITFVQREINNASAVNSQQCGQAINAAIKRLSLRGCENISTEIEIADILDPKCAIYHPEGGGLQSCAVLSTASCGKPIPGTVCPDGSVYVGLSPDGYKHMFTTPHDGGYDTYNNGTNFGAGVWVDTPMPNCSGTGGSCVTGRANTELLATLSDTGAPYKSAVYCAALVAHGYDDWYLPAKLEIDVIFKHQDVIGNIDQSGAWTNGYYQTSSEENDLRAWVLRMGTSYDPQTRDKHHHFTFRCVRKE